MIARSQEIADLFGWAKTYDAEYFALVEFLGYRLVTDDLRFHRRAERLDFVFLPEELLKPAT